MPGIASLLWSGVRETVQLLGKSVGPFGSSAAKGIDVGVESLQPVSVPHVEDGVYSLMGVECSTNTGPSNITFYSRIDGVIGGQSVLVPAFTTGTFYDPLGSDTISDGLTHYLTFISSLRPFDFGTSFGYSGIGCYFTPTRSGVAVARTVANAIFPGPLAVGTELFISAVGDMVTNSDFNKVRLHLNTTGKIKQLFARISLNNTDQDNILVMYKNNTATSLTLPISAGYNGPIFANLTDNFDFSPGDAIAWKLEAVQGTAGQSLRINTLVYTIETTTGYCPAGSAATVGLASADNGSSLYMSGLIQAYAGHTFGKIYVRMETRFKGLGTEVISNVSNTDWYLRSYKNGILSVQAALIPSFTTGYFHDPANEDLLEDGDYIQAVLDTNGSSGQVITLTVIDYMSSTLTPTPPPNRLSGIYKIIPYSGKPNDTLWNLNFTGTTDVKIPDPNAIIVGVGR